MCCLTYLIIAGLRHILSLHFTVLILFDEYCISFIASGINFTFTFMHLADAFIQSDLHCIQVIVSTFFLSALAFPGNRTHDLGVANAMLYQLSYRKAVELMHIHI